MSISLLHVYTTLFLILGASEAVTFLLKSGAPTGVYDSYGNSAMFLVIEKMPKLAFEGLNQFFVEDNAMRRRYYYLDHLEFDVKSKGAHKDARNVLQVTSSSACNYNV